MYVAIIDGVIHYSTQQKEGYHELKGSSSVPQSAEEEIRGKITVLQDNQSTSDAALQELILATVEV